MAKKPQNRASGHIRLIAGQYRGRKLPVLDREGLRPTTDRVKETLFNWLAPIITGARCLDCFAGSGSLGLEASSRYAKSVTMIEFDRSVAQQITQNITLLKANATVHHTNALQYLANQGVPHDVVFLDPPFRKGFIKPAIELLENNGWLAQDAWIYVEAEAESAANDVPPRWQLHREKTAGQVAYRLYHRSDN